MKVLFINTSDTNGGAARASYRIYKGLQSLGVDCKFFVKNKCQNDDTIFSLQQFVPHNILYKIYAWCINKIKNKIQHYHWRKYSDKDDVYMSDMRSTPIHNALSYLDSDIIHLHWINQRFLPLEKLVELNKPIVWTLHDSWAFCGVCHYFYNCQSYKKECGDCPFLHSRDHKDISNKVWNAKKSIYSKLNMHIVSPSNWLAECARQSNLFKNVPVIVIPNCLDTEIFKPIDKEIALKYFGLDLNKRYILYGAMNAIKDKNKGFNELLLALKSIVNSKELKNTELLVFGANESINELDIGIEIHSLGFLSDDKDLMSLYNAADVMVVPSLSENLSCAIMESLSCGTPVVSFNIGGNSDLIDHKLNGYLAKENDSIDLGNGILWVLNQNNIDLSLNARNKVLNNYTIEIVSNRYRELYTTIVNDKNKYEHENNITSQNYRSTR